MNNVLAVNRHWHGALLDYEPTKLSIILNKTSDKFVERVLQRNLTGLKYFHFDGYVQYNHPNKEGFDTDHKHFSKFHTILTI